MNDSLRSFLLTVDVGNSRIKFGLFERNERNADREAGPALPTCLKSIARPIDGELPWNEIRNWFDAHEDPRVVGVVAGANPEGLDRVLDSWPGDAWTLPEVINNPTQIPLDCDVEEPEKVGIDRLLNAFAANEVRPAERPALIVDSGTATTVDFVTAEGAFAGGAILPGFELAARSLHHYTALLPLISIEELSGQTHDPLGKDTRKALQSGLVWGQLGAVRELIDRISEQSATQPYLILTGGGASLLAPHLEGARWEPHLALQGLALVADRLHD